MVTNQEEWQSLWRGVSDITEMFSEGIIFIGGVAVYLHARSQEVPEGWLEFSHDGDFYISLADFSELRDYEEVVSNRRLSKYQFIKYGIEFDVYLEFNNNLRVTYQDVRANEQIIENVPVASLEHLLLLKLDAYNDRKGSAKGRKDERDIIRIGHLLSAPKRLKGDRLRPYLVERDLKLLDAIVRRSAEFSSMGSTQKQTDQLRSDFVSLLSRATRILRAAS